MKNKQINKQKVSVFTEQELKENMNLTQEQVDLVMSYQEKFPELLKEKEGFCISARNLWRELGIKRRFADWIKDRITKYDFRENIDYSSFHISVKREIGATVVSEYYLTIDSAKELCMIQNNDNGRIVRRYFILMENTLKDYKSWNITRESEKDGWNEMSKQIKLWCIRKGFDYTIRKFYTREANMLNEALLGLSAQEINIRIDNHDEITRNHLNERINNSIYELEKLNINLLQSDLDFGMRKTIINNSCKNNYSRLRHVLDEKIA